MGHYNVLVGDFNKNVYEYHLAKRLAEEDLRL